MPLDRLLGGAMVVHAFGLVGWLVGWLGGWLGGWVVGWLILVDSG